MDISSTQILQPQILPSNLMNPLFLTSKLNLKPTTSLFTSLPFRYFSTTSQHLQNPIEELIQPPKRKPTLRKKSIQNLNESWFSSLSTNSVETNKIEGNTELKWIIGIDPDVSGALALLKYDHSGFISSQVFDSPFVQLSIGKTRRKRLDAKSIVEMLQSFNAPIGTTAYLEQSIPFPRDGKQGWWSGGFTYGLWIGVLVASGFSVVPVPSSVWKKEFELARSTSSKDDSRELAAHLFPDLSSMLKRKKDHGRAEALLIAAYGKGLQTKLDESCASHESLEAIAEL